MDALVRIDRAERFEIDGPATLRLKPDLPLTVTVVNLSRSGCLLRGARRMQIGATISIGIPGIGARIAQVSRTGPDGCGCAFVTPLSAAEIRSALEAAALRETAASDVVRQLRETHRTSEPAPVTPPFGRAIGAARRCLARLSGR